MGGDGALLGVEAVTNVSIHAPTWGATLPFFSSRAAACFNPRPHMGGDTPDCSLFLVVSCFNPRPHMGGDVLRHVPVPLHPVSIHAPTWGATHAFAVVKFYGLVSIHAPTWGATVVHFYFDKSI